jgi:hypothetical protein
MGKCHVGTAYCIRDEPVPKVFAYCSDPDCPLKTWSKACTDLDQQLKKILQQRHPLEQLRQISIAILSASKDARCPEDKKEEWVKAIDGWPQFWKKVGRVRGTRVLWEDRFEQACRDFNDNRLTPLISHAMNLKPRDQHGRRIHCALECNQCWSEIPRTFYLSAVGKELAIFLANIFHKDTYSKVQNNNITLFLASNYSPNYRSNCLGDLFDSTVFESSLQILDHILPIVAVAGTNKPIGYLHFLTGKNLISSIGAQIKKIPSATTTYEKNITLPGQAGSAPTSLKVKFEIIARADRLGSKLLGTVMNASSFLQVCADLQEKGGSFKNDIRYMKASAELTVSLFSLSEAKALRSATRTAGRFALGLEGFLSFCDARKELQYSSKQDPRYLITASNAIKGIGAFVMIGCLPIGAFIYLAGTIGCVAFDHDPFIRWAEYTYFGRHSGDSKRHKTADEALKELERIVKISQE